MTWELTLTRKYRDGDYKNHERASLISCLPSDWQGASYIAVIIRWAHLLRGESRGITLRTADPSCRHIAMAMGWCPTCFQELRKLREEASQLQQEKYSISEAGPEERTHSCSCLRTYHYNMRACYLTQQLCVHSNLQDKSTLRG